MKQVIKDIFYIYFRGSYQAFRQEGLFEAIYTKELAILMDERSERCFAFLANKAIDVPTISFG